MNCQKKLIKFVQMKNEIIEKETGIKYIEQEDIDDIKEWSEEDCTYAYNDLEFFINSCNADGLTEHTCIWCFKYLGKRCKECEYGLQHGICRKDNSLFNSYKTKEVKALLTNIVYKKMIEQINQDNY